MRGFGLEVVESCIREHRAQMRLASIIMQKERIDGVFLDGQDETAAQTKNKVADDLKERFERGEVEFDDPGHGVFYPLAPHEGEFRAQSDLAWAVAAAHARSLGSPAVFQPTEFKPLVILLRMLIFVSFSWFKVFAKFLSNFRDSMAHAAVTAGPAKKVLLFMGREHDVSRFFEDPQLKTISISFDPGLDYEIKASEGVEVPPYLRQTAQEAACEAAEMEVDLNPWILKVLSGS
jgi:hypothetical protein